MPTHRITTTLSTHRARLLRVGVSIAAGLGISLLAAAVRAALTRPTEIDFHVFYESGRAWRAGADLYATAAEFPNLNPPQFIVAFAPLTWLPEEAAVAVLIALNLACAVAAAAIIWRQLNLPVSFTSVMAAIAAAGLTTGLQFGLEEGHPTGVLALGFTVAWAAARARRCATAGIIVGLLASLKPFFACVLLASILRRDWKTVVWAAGAAAFAVSAGVVLAGPESFARWIETGRQVSWFNHPLNGSLAGLAARGQLGWGAWGVAAAALLAATGLAIRRSRNSDVDWLVCGLASLLVSPLGWVYYLPVLAGPLAAMAIRRPVILLGASGLVWPVPLVMMLAPINIATTLTVFSIATWSLLALWGSSVWAAVRQSPSSAAPVRGALAR